MNYCKNHDRQSLIAIQFCLITIVQKRCIRTSSMIIRIQMRMRKCMRQIKCNTKLQGRSSRLKSGGAQGGTIFSSNFYCIFGRFGKMTHLVNLKKCRGSSPGCPGGYYAPASQHKSKDSIFEFQSEQSTYHYSVSIVQMFNH